MRARKPAVSGPVLRIYLRRSKADQGHQQFSLDVQREGCRRFAAEELPRRGAVLDWDLRIEYVDDDRAGDDFIGRAGLQHLLADVQAGDVVLCRDQSRLGRDALEVTLAIRELVRDRGARLIYYVNGQEVPFANAMDAATTFIQGTGHQLELENIRSRTREALRQRVRDGRIAGGRCYGYDLKRMTDASGRQYTIAVVNEREADVLRRMFREFLSGAGLKTIAIGLNNDGIASPRANKRGTGSWAPSCIRSMLLNPRYRGVYVHGRIQFVRRGGKKLRLKGKPEEILHIDIPEWRITDDDTWYAVQEIFAERRREGAGKQKRPGPATKYALSGLARCKLCEGAIGVARAARLNDENVAAYACTWHRQRGPAVCSMAIAKPVTIVEAKLTQEMKHRILAPDSIEAYLEQVREEARRQTAVPPVDTSGLEGELAVARGEQRNLARAIASAGQEFPELLAEMRQRNDRIKRLEDQIRAARRTPAMEKAQIEQVVTAVRGHLEDLASALARDPAGAREVFNALSEEITFEPAPGNRKAFLIRVTARPKSVNYVATPTGFEPVSPA